jgi:exosortase B
MQKNATQVGNPRKISQMAAWRKWKIWLVAGVGFAAMLVPTLLRLFTGVWSSDEQGHGPIVLGISLWLIYQQRERLIFAPGNSLPGLLPSIIGWSLMIFGCALYAIGRSQNILSAEALSLIIIFTALILLLRGKDTCRALWFPLFFLIFTVPLPGTLVAAITQPLKTAVSISAEYMLYNAGYPISRTGVILQIGPYQLLVADACAGLHTLFTLEALGLLYLNLVRHSSMLRNISLALLIVPISFSANVIRVIVLTMVTYYLGDEAGQGFLHGFAGMVLFMSALLLIIATDSLLRWGTTVKTEIQQA